MKKFLELISKPFTNPSTFDLFVIFFVNVFLGKYLSEIISRDFATPIQILSAISILIINFLSLYSLYHWILNKFKF